MYDNVNVNVDFWAAPAPAATETGGGAGENNRCVPWLTVAVGRRAVGRRRVLAAGVCAFLPRYDIARDFVFSRVSLDFFALDFDCLYFRRLAAMG